MSLFFGSRPESRAVNAAWLTGVDTGGSVSSSAGVKVTRDKALRVGAMWSSTHLLASIVSDFPVDVFRGKGAGKQPVTPPALVARPSLVVSRREWMYQAMMSLLLRGNAFGLVVARDSVGRPTVVEWLDPDTVEVDQSSALEAPTYKLSGRPVDPDDMIHLRAYVQPGSAVGLSPVAYHAETIGISIAARKYGGQWYAGGGHPTALFQNKTATIDPEKAATIKARIKSVLRGGSREPLVLGADWDYKPLQVSASESEFINALGYTDAQIAHMYGPGVAEVLGYTQSGSSLTYSNRVDRSLDLLTYSVMPWVNKFEDFLTAAIAQPHTVRFNTNAMLRADNKARHEVYRIDREIGLYSINELRGFEDAAPLPDGQGDDYTPLAAKAPAPSTEDQNGD